ncbi:hypothetical protein [Thalassobius sp. I31.1]|uniref:hypothetical protein n=1 Tax=Thalassobius sp. I31.1 TaxID=2109912 RepID=UPI000D1B59D9|nr:hypothetical protein [Thalassobius sp. I31.1]
MGAIAYKDGGWIDLNGRRSDVNLLRPFDSDYYYATEKGKILRLYSDACNGTERLGEILSLEGKVVAEIPPFVHPSFKEPKKLYKSQLAWVQYENGDDVGFVVYCANPQDFRVKFNLSTLNFSAPEFGVR